MTDKKLTLGQAIDKIIDALEPLEQEARQTAVRAACSHLGVVISLVESQSVVASTANILTQPNPEITSATTDIRTLKEQKKPSSAAQMACIVAYYLKEIAPEKERKDTVTAKDLEKYFKQAAFKLPKNIPQLLPDSRAAGYFDSAQGKGEYALNAVGYNLVVHNLPKSSGK